MNLKIYQNYCPCYLHLYMACFLTNCLQNARNAASDNPFFQNFLGENTPRPPFSFQNHLTQCKELLLKKEEVNIRLHFEHTNRRDENAIVVQVKLCDSSGEKLWKPIGYIPGPKVPKVTIALQNEEVKVVTVKNVFYQYVPPINDFQFFPSIVVSKLGRWPQNKKDYQYNEKI